MKILIYFLNSFEMGWNKMNYSVLFGWEIIAKVRR